MPFCHVVASDGQHAEGSLPSLPVDGLEGGNGGSAYVPRAISALLQGGYWVDLGPDSVYTYSHIAAAVWLSASGMLALVAGVVLSHRVLVASRGGVRAGSRVAALAAWACGRVAGVFLFLYYLLAVTTVRWW
jgi:hypothetical protein